jgi:hypothetical protein
MTGKVFFALLSSILLYSGVLQNHSQPLKYIKHCFLSDDFWGLFCGLPLVTDGSGGQESACVESAGRRRPGDVQRCCAPTSA